MEILDLGIKAYADTLEIQTELLQKRIRGQIKDTLIIVEHLPVVTTGRLKGVESIIDPDYFKEKNTPVIATNRGGGVTYHSPGQLVIYPVIDLSYLEKNISSFIDFLEITIANSLTVLDIPVLRIKGKRGVWLDQKKIAFTGIAFKKWVSYHGVSININNDTFPFSKMYPCGEKDIEAISVKEYTGDEHDMIEVKEVFARQFRLDFNKRYSKILLV